MKRPLTTGILLAAIAGVAWLVWTRTHSEGAGKTGGRPPVSVSIAAVRAGAAPVSLIAVGQVQSPHPVAVRPQVNGTLMAVYFREGATVKSGDRLALIDPAPYRTAVEQAKAVLERDRAAAQGTKSALDRLLPLAEKEYATPQEIENARSAYAQSLAVVESDVAALSRAQLDLDRTVILSPIDGRTGSLTVKPGNLVGTADASPLLTVNQMQPVQVDFSAPQSRLGDIRDAMARGPVTVSIAAEDGGAKLDEGHLIFVDNAVDTATGTVRLKAESPNAGETLWPGAFVTVTVTLAVQADALLVPESAVLVGAEGPYVFKVGADRKAQLVGVAVDRQVGHEVVISKGLAAGDSVVAKAPRNLLPGSTVAPAGEVSGKDAGKEKGSDAAP